MGWRCVLEEVADAAPAGVVVAGQAEVHAGSVGSIASYRVEREGNRAKDPGTDTVWSGTEHGVAEGSEVVRRVPGGGDWSGR